MDKSVVTMEIERLATIIAKSEAIDFIEYMDKVADANHLDSDLLIKEVLTYINRIRGEQRCIAYSERSE